MIHLITINKNIELLKNLKEQPQTTPDRNLPSNTIVRRRPTPG